MQRVSSLSNRQFTKGEKITLAPIDIDDDINSITIVCHRESIRDMQYDLPALMITSRIRTGSNEWEEFIGCRVDGGKMISRQGFEIEITRVGVVRYEGVSRQIEVTLEALESTFVNVDLDQMIR